MQVLKFGGTSVGSAENINRVIAIVNSAVKRDRTVVVASAIGGCTDTLTKIAELAGAGDSNYDELLTGLKERHFSIVASLIADDYRKPVLESVENLFGELAEAVRSVCFLRELSSSALDMILGYGELLSTTIIAEKFRSIGQQCKWLDARGLIRTRFCHGKNVVDMETTAGNISTALKSSSMRLFIVPGFIAADDTDKTTTLGRGGSDYTAAIIASAIEARALEIWTDVDGMMTADPRIVPDARTIRHISYKEALELSHFGAKVIFPSTIQPAVRNNIPILVKNSFAPENEGTLIEKNPPEASNRVKGISGSKHIALLSMEGSGMIGTPGYSSRLFDVLARNNIDIILITQASSIHTMLIAISEEDAVKAKEVADERFAYEISQKVIEPLKVEKGYAIISLVGNDMVNQSGTAARMFEAIGSRGVNIRAIANGSSEKNVSAVVGSEDFEEAVRGIHSEFFVKPVNQINLFIAGYGNVGKSLVEIIQRRARIIEREINVSLNIAGVCNSRRSIIGSSGLDIESIQAELCANKAAESKADPSVFVEKISSLGLKNSVFIDCTSSFEVSALYRDILSRGISIVTCNKIANSSDMHFYKSIHDEARKNGVFFRYETNVGAGLPVISTIRQILNSGDNINRIEATLSGSLNYIFSNYDGSRPFASVVREAQELGYTEPDPRTDLRGLDLQRKALILVRELGLEVEMADITTKPFLPEELLAGSVDDFYKAMEIKEDYFLKLYEKALENNKHIAYSIDIAGNVITVGAGEFAVNHSFAGSVGTDCVIVIYSDFYPNGLKIIGAGAGVWQTASGLLNNILQ